MRISGNIQAVFFKLGARNVYHKRNKMASVMPLPREHALFQSLSVKKQISPYATLSHGTEGPSRNIYDAYIVLTLLRRFLRVNDPLLR